MNSPFTFIPLVSQNFVQKLFLTKDPENAIIELNNLFADKPISEILISDIIQLERKYQVNFNRAYKKNLIDIYTKLLVHYLNDGKLSNEEKNNLKNIKVVLNLADSDIKDIHISLTSKIYKDKFETAISDNNYTNEKLVLLNDVRENLELSNDITDEISKEHRTSKLQSIWRQIISDNRVSPDEMKEFEALCKALSVTPDMDNASLEALSKMKLLWVIENGDLPEIQVELNLNVNERCVYTGRVSWYENRKVIEKINYHGATLTIPIYKGLRYKIGSVSPSRVTKDEITLIDTGLIYFTTKRVIFIGKIETKTIPISKILFIETIEGGIVINKGTKISPILVSNEEDHLMPLFLNRLIKK